MTDTTKRPAKADATLTLLWERIRRRGDMPGFARAINAILASMRGEDEREFSMTQTVLSDPVLTQKVLRLANSGMYSAFGQRINTVSKAVLVLGTDAIGHLALGLKLVEELARTRPDSAPAHAEMEKAVLAGMVAQQVAASAASRDPEEAAVCSILHSLGRMMVTFYMPERWAQLQEMAGAGHEDEAAPALLGLSLEEVGRAAAEQWGLPRNLVAAMRSVAPAAPAAPLEHDEWLAALGTMSAQCARSLWHDDPEGAERVQALVASFAPMLGVEPEKALAAIDKAKAEAANDLSLAPLARPAEKRAKALASSRKRAESNKILMGGVAELRESLPHASTGQAMAMALETVYNALSATRAFAFLRSRREGRYAARIGLGQDARALLPELSFRDTYEPNVFHAALGSDRVIFIEQAQEPKFASKLPAWWKASLSGRSFIVLPFAAHGHPAGFLYAEWDGGVSAGAFGQAEFGLLNDLRTALAHALERRHQVESPVFTR